MNVYVTTDQRFWQYQNHIYAEAVAGYKFWKRYLDGFTTVTVVARVQVVDRLPKTAVRADGDGIQFAALPTYIGPIAALSKLPNLQRRIKEIASNDAAYILRVPGTIGTLMHKQLAKQQWPFAIEVVGDPQDSLSPQALGSAWGYLARPFAVRALEQQSQQANCAAFVTRETLQRRYPPKGTFSTHYSSIELPQAHFDLAGSIRTSQVEVNSTPTLIFVGSLSQRYKGLHVLLQAMRLCLDEGVALNLTVLGDGQYRQEYEQLTQTLGLKTAVTFLGYIPQGEAVIKQLCAADLFVMPSLMEGLPRAMIEAMACGLPCIGTTIGGIPELLSSEEIVSPGDSKSLAQKIQQFLDNPKQMEQMGKHNRQVSLDYRSDHLQQRRHQLYTCLQDITDTHISLQQPKNKIT